MELIPRKGDEQTVCIYIQNPLNHGTGSEALKKEEGSAPVTIKESNLETNTPQFRQPEGKVNLSQTTENAGSR